MRALTLRLPTDSKNSCGDGNNEALAREGIDTPAIENSVHFLFDSNNEALAREGIDTKQDTNLYPSDSAVTMRH